MYRWEWPPLLVPRIVHFYGTLNNFFLLHSLLPRLQYDLSAGVSRMTSSDPLGDDEKQWLAVNLVVLIGQLTLLACMWTSLQSRLSKKNVNVEFAGVVELLPKWGLVRGAHSLYKY